MTSPPAGISSKWRALLRVVRWGAVVSVVLSGYFAWEQHRRQEAYARLERVAWVNYRAQYELPAIIRRYCPNAILRAIHRMNPKVPGTITFRKEVTDVGHSLEGIPTERVYHVAFDRCLQIPDNLDVLAKFPNLQEVRFHQCHLSQSILETIPELPSVQWLILSSCTVPPTMTVNYSHLPSLRFLMFEETNTGDSMLRGLAGHPSLLQISLIGTSITDHGLREIRSLPQLREMHLGHTQVTGVGLTDLDSPLVKLNMAGTQASDDGMSAIARITTLNDLDLARTRVTALGVSRLRRLPQLERLILDRCDVGDETLPHLQAMPSIKRWRAVKTRMVKQTTLP